MFDVHINVLRLQWFGLHHKLPKASPPRNYHYMITLLCLDGRSCLYKGEMRLVPLKRHASSWLGKHPNELILLHAGQSLESDDMLRDLVHATCIHVVQNRKSHARLAALYYQARDLHANLSRLVINKSLYQSALKHVVTYSSIRHQSKPTWPETYTGLLVAHNYQLAKALFCVS